MKPPSITLPLYNTPNCHPSIYETPNIKPYQYVFPHFYGLPKIHKAPLPNLPLPPFRGIIASVHGPTTRASYYLDSVLNHLVPLYCGEHWCKDTQHVLQEINLLNARTTFNSDLFSLLTIDVVD